jgi:hypothetical protein
MSKKADDRRTRVRGTRQESRTRHQKNGGLKSDDVGNIGEEKPEEEWKRTEERENIRGGLNTDPRRSGGLR